MIKIYIPGLPCKSYEYRRGDAQIIHDDEKNCIIIDGGEPDLCNKILAYCRNVGITHATYILTHWHPDHDAGMKQLLESSLVIDRIYCPPPAEVKALDIDDYNRACRRIAQAKALKKQIIYPNPNAVTHVVVGKIRCHLWRRAGNRNDKTDYQVNNTSIQTYFPDMYYLSTGDIINAFEGYLSILNAPVKVFKVPHHGNACTDGPCRKLKELGAELCWYNDWEKKGASVGSSSFSKWGAGYCKKYFHTLRTDADIYMTAFAKTLQVQYGHNHYSYAIPYDGKAPTDRWVKGAKGWWYEYADGTYAVGWKKLKWSKGENWFYFTKDGWMCTGWVYDGGCWYFCDGNGAMKTGWLTYKGKRCYLEPTAGKNQGHAYMSQTAVIDGKTYVFDSDCYATEIKEAEEPRSKSRLNVIDIASYQSGLDLRKVKVDGVIIKASQGTGYVNPCCNRHYDQAKEAGILRGLYHYANGSGAVAEAHFFVDTIKDCIGDAILALDWEGAQNRAFGNMDVGYCKTFLDCVYQLTGVRPLIYMSKSVCRAHDWSPVAEHYGLWAAQYANMNQTGFQEEPWTDNRGWGAWESPAIYQYSSRGRLAGYDGNLDMDIAYMSAAGWRKYASKS